MDARRDIVEAAVWREAAGRGARPPVAFVRAAVDRILANAPAEEAPLREHAARGAREAVAAVLHRGGSDDARRDFREAVAHLREVAKLWTAAHQTHPHVGAAIRGFDCLFALLDGTPACDVAARCSITEANLHQIVHRTKERLRPHVRDPRALRIVDSRMPARRSA